MLIACLRRKGYGAAGTGGRRCDAMTSCGLVGSGLQTFFAGSVAQSVEQRPFKALVPGSSPGRPILSMAWVYILRGASGRHYIGSTDNLDRRLREHERGSNHTTRRFAKAELVAAKQMPSMTEARSLETELKKKKNPRLAIFALKS